MFFNKFCKTVFGNWLKFTIGEHVYVAMMYSNVINTKKLV